MGENMNEHAQQVVTTEGDTDGHELAAVLLPHGTSSWLAAVSADDPSETVGCAGAMATVRREGDRVELTSSDDADLEVMPFRVWMEARGQALRVMVASRGEPLAFRLTMLRPGSERSHA